MLASLKISKSLYPSTGPDPAISPIQSVRIPVFDGHTTICGRSALPFTHALPIQTLAQSELNEGTQMQPECWQWPTAVDQVEVKPS